MKFIYEVIDGGQAPKAPGPGDAGYDVFARLGEGATINGVQICAPEIADVPIGLGCGDTAKVPLGFRAIIPTGHHADLRPRSGWSSRGVHVALGLIDEGYRGEWCAIVTNLGTEPVTIEHGAKIAQVVFVETVLPEIVEGPVSIDTARGEDGFGSSDDTGTAGNQAPFRPDLMARSTAADEVEVECVSIVGPPSADIKRSIRPYRSPPRDVAKVVKPDDGCIVDNSHGFHIGETAYHDRHGQGWISRYIEDGQTAIVIFLSAGTRAVDVHHLRPSSFGTKIPKPHVAFAMALQSQRQTVGVGLDEMPDAALDVERGRLPLGDANVGLDEWLDRIKVNIADRVEWHRRASMARRGRELGDDRLAQLDPFKPGDLVWWSAEHKVGDFRRYVEANGKPPLAKVEFWYSEGWRLVAVADLTQPPPGRLMRLVRKAADMTISETARRMGVSVARLSGWEQCEVEPPAGDDLVRWLECFDTEGEGWRDAIVAYVNANRDRWTAAEPRPFAADTMRPDVSIPGEDPARATARARWMAAHHHGAGYHEWNSDHPAPIEALRAYIESEGGGPLGYSDQHALLGELEWLRMRSDRLLTAAVDMANAVTGDDFPLGTDPAVLAAEHEKALARLRADRDDYRGANARAIALAREWGGLAARMVRAAGVDLPIGRIPGDEAVQHIEALRADRDNLRASEKAADAEIKRLGALVGRVTAEADARIARIAEALGHDKDGDGDIVDRAAGLMQGSLDLEAAFDAVALSVDAAQGEDEAHIDYVRRVVELVRELRGHRDMLDRGVYVASEEIDGLRAERDTLRARYADHCEALDSIAAVTVSDAFDDGTGQVPPKDAAAVIVAHVERMQSALADEAMFSTDTSLHAAVRRLFSRLHVAPAAGETIVDTLDRIGSSLGPVADMSGVVPEVEPGALLVTLEGGGTLEVLYAEGTGWMPWAGDEDDKVWPGEPIDGPFWILQAPTIDAPLARKIDVRPPAGTPPADKPARRPMLMLGPVQPHAHLRVEARAQAALAEKVEQERQRTVIPAPDGTGAGLECHVDAGFIVVLGPDGKEWRSPCGDYSAAPGAGFIKYVDMTVTRWKFIR